jgi:hypothetical protein
MKTRFTKRLTNDEGSATAEYAIATIAPLLRVSGVGEAGLRIDIPVPIVRLSVSKQARIYDARDAHTLRLGDPLRKSRNHVPQHRHTHV